VITDFWQIFTRWELLSGWTFVIALFAAIYAIGVVRLGLRSDWASVRWRRVLAAGVFFAMIFVALVGPFEALAGEALFAHMVQHMLVIFAAPLTLLANPLASYMWGLPPAARAGLGELTRREGALTRVLGVLTRPKVSLPLFVLILWAWHYPPLYNAALENGFVHILEHLTMFFGALIFWWPLIGPAPRRTPLSYPRQIVYLVVVLTPSAALGALITLSPNALYSFYEGAPMHFGLSALQDQQIAGLILWVFGNAAYLAALITAFLRWSASERRRDAAAG